MVEMTRKNNFEERVWRGGKRCKNTGEIDKNQGKRSEKDSSGKEEFKKEVMKKFEVKFAEAMKDKHKTLWELEEEVQGIKMR